MASIPVSRQQLSIAISQLIPYVVSGMQPNFGLQGRQRDVTQRQVLMLTMLHTGGPCRMSAIAQRLQVRLPTATGIVNRLAAGGYVRRLGSAHDRRQVVITLTAKGQAFIGQFQEAVRRRWDEVLRSLEPREREAFYHVVTKLQQRLHPAA